MTMAKTTKGKDMNRSLVLFTLRGEYFAIENSLISQIIQNPFINPVANTIPYFLGSTAFQGEVLAAIDLATYFYGKDGDSKRSASSSKRNFLVVESENQTIFLMVESVLGIIDKPDESLTRGIFINDEIKENSFFKLAFLWKELIVVQLKIELIFNQILIDSNIYFQNSISSLQVPTSFTEISNSLEEYNIKLQHHKQKTTPSGWRADRLIRPPKEVKYTGTVVSVQNLSVLIPNENLSQIFSITQLTEIPNTSKIVVGAINYQGEVINALDLTELLFDSKIRDNSYKVYDHSRALIVEYGNEKLALIMDEIPRIIEIQKTEIRQTIILNNEDNNDYLFQGAILEHSGNIILVLNVEYIFTKYFTPDKLEKSASHIVSFSKPESLIIEQVKSTSQEGLLIQNGDNLYFIDSEFVLQIVKQEAFFRTEYSHNAILGITSHQELNPLVDFEYLIEGEKKENNFQGKLAGILLHDQKSGLDATFVVENILGRVSIDQLDVFQPETSFYTKMLSRMISGFFSYRGRLGIIVNPIRLLEETFSIIKTDLGMDKVDDLVSKLNSEDKQSLIELQGQNRERENYISSHGEGDRLDYLVFELGETKLAVDVSFIKGVYCTSVEIKKSSTTTGPIIGEAHFDDKEYPILDLAKLIMVTNSPIALNDEIDFILLNSETKIYLIPVDNLEAVVSTFKNDFSPSKATNLFLEGDKCCQHQFSVDDNSSSSVNIIENEFLINTIIQLGTNTPSTNKTRKK